MMSNGFGVCIGPALHRGSIPIPGAASIHLLSTCKNIIFRLQRDYLYIASYFRWVLQAEVPRLSKLMIRSKMYHREKRLIYSTEPEVSS